MSNVRSPQGSAGWSHGELSLVCQRRAALKQSVPRALSIDRGAAVLRVANAELRLRQVGPSVHWRPAHRLHLRGGSAASAITGCSSFGEQLTGTLRIVHSWCTPLRGRSTSPSSRRLAELANPQAVRAHWSPIQPRAQQAPRASQARHAVRKPNPSIERTALSQLRWPKSSAHVER